MPLLHKDSTNNNLTETWAHQIVQLFFPNIHIIELESEKLKHILIKNFKALPQIFSLPILIH